MVCVEASVSTNRQARTRGCKARGASSASSGSSGSI